MQKHVPGITLQAESGEHDTMDIPKPCLSEQDLRNPALGPFQIMFKEASQCPPGSVKEALVNLSGTLHYDRGSNGMVYDGVLLLEKDINRGDIGIKLDIAKWDNVAGWRENAFHLDGGEYCTVMSTIGRDVSQHVSRNIPRFPSSCPLAAGIYTIRNFSTDMGQFQHFPVFPYGRFRGDLMFYRWTNKDIIGCFRGVSDIVPRRTT